MQVLERQIEQAFLVGLRRLPAIAIKLQPVANRGWPDRLVVLPGGRVVFIEFKRPGEGLRPLQAHRQKQLRSLGHDVKTFDTPTKAISYITGKMGTARLPKKGG